MTTKDPPQSSDLYGYHRMLVITMASVLILAVETVGAVRNQCLVFKRGDLNFILPLNSPMIEACVSGCRQNTCRNVFRQNCKKGSQADNTVDFNKWPTRLNGACQDNVCNDGTVCTPAAVGYLCRYVSCSEDEGYMLLNTSTGIPVCFKYFTYRVEWETARKRCHDDEAELIVLDSEEKDALIVQYLNRYNLGRHTRTWVGMVKEVDKKIRYKWLNNSTHIRWGFGEPDVHDDQRCGQLDKAGISDIVCNFQREFICEKRVS